MAKEREGNCWAFTCKTCGHRYKWSGAMLPVPPCPKCKPQKKRVQLDATTDVVAEAVEQCERIISLCEEVPERGEEFALSVMDSVREVMETIQATRHVTERQKEALDNWEGGVRVWIR